MALRKPSKSISEQMRMIDSEKKAIANERFRELKRQNKFIDLTKPKKKKK